jgi:hypothetical protein
VAAVDCTWGALTLTRQLQTLDLPPFSSFDMHMRPTLAIDMPTLALSSVGLFAAVAPIDWLLRVLAQDLHCHARSLPLLVVQQDLWGTN